MLRHLCQSLKCGGKLGWFIKSKCLGNIIPCLGYFNSFLNGLPTLKISSPSILDIAVKLISLERILIYYFLVEIFKGFAMNMKYNRQSLTSKHQLQLHSQPFPTAPAQPAMCPTRGPSPFLTRSFPCCAHTFHPTSVKPSDALS